MRRSRFLSAQRRASRIGISLYKECYVQFILDDEDSRTSQGSLVEMPQQQREVFYELILEALEDMGLAKVL